METCLIEATAPAVNAARAYRVSEPLLLRVAGMPLSAAEPLRDPLGAAHRERSLSLSSQLTTRAGVLSDLLHAEVREAPGDATLQHALLGVRRAVFNGRFPSSADLDLVIPRLSAEVRIAVEEWLLLKQDLDRHNREAEQHIQRTLENHRRELQAAALHSGFRRGLLLSSPSFERALDDYSGARLTKPDRKIRRTERTLLAYLFRTIYKTSPFSTLTPVALLRLSGDPDARIYPDLDAAPLLAEVRPNLGLLARLRQALAENAVRYPTLRLEKVEGAAIVGKRIRYWKRAETPLRADGPVHSRVTETSFFLQLTPSLQALLKFLDRRGAASVAELKSALTAMCLNEEEAAEYLQLLVENGFLLLAGLRRSVFEPGYWHEFARELRATGDASLGELAVGVVRIESAARGFGETAVADRPRRLAAIEDDADRLLSRLEGAGPRPSPVLYEDARTHSTPVHRELWTKEMAPLAELQRVLAVFDPFLVSKVTLRALFKKRFGLGGTCSDILAFSDYFQEAFYRPYQQATAEARRLIDQQNPFGRGTLNPLKLPEVTALANARAALASQLENAIRDAGETSEYVIDLPDWVQDLGQEMLERHEMLSNSFFFQIADGNAGRRLVLNHVYGGFGSMFTRFAHLFPRAGNESLECALRENLRSLQPKNVLFAEFQGGHDTNLNQHSLLAPAQLVLPGESATCSSSRPILLTELCIRHRPETDDVVLYSDRLGIRVVPLYLGMLYALVLPELQTLLLHFAPPTVLRTTFSPKPVPTEGAVAHQPRIRYRNVILERERWTVSLAAIPKRCHGEGDYAYFLRLERWRRQAGIPPVTFASLIPTVSAMHEEDGARAYTAAAPQKPFYLSFDQPLALLQFEKLLADSTGYLQFAEALPKPEESILHDKPGQHRDRNRETYVAEFVADITQGSFR